MYGTGGAPERETADEEDPPLCNNREITKTIMTAFPHAGEVRGDPVSNIACNVPVLHAGRVPIPLLVLITRAKRAFDLHANK